MAWVIREHPFLPNDVRSAAMYIAAYNPDAAVRLSYGVTDTVTSLRDYPLSYSSALFVHPALTKFRRALVTGFDGYGLYFLADEAARTVRVYGLFHGSRDDIPSQLEEREDWV